MKNLKEKLNLKIIIPVIVAIVLLAVVVIVVTVNAKNKERTEFQEARLRILGETCRNINDFSVKLEKFVQSDYSTSNEASEITDLHSKIEEQVRELKGYEEDYKSFGTAFEESYNEVIKMYEEEQETYKKMTLWAYMKGKGNSKTSVVSSCDKIQEMYEATSAKNHY